MNFIFFKSWTSLTEKPTDFDPGKGGWLWQTAFASDTWVSISILWTIEEASQRTFLQPKVSWHHNLTSLTHQASKRRSVASKISPLTLIRTFFLVSDVEPLVLLQPVFREKPRRRWFGVEALWTLCFSLINYNHPYT